MCDMIGKLGKKIGEGGCAEVFEWEDDNKVIKLAKPNTSVTALRREFHHCQIAWDCGLPVPKPVELINVDGRSGVVFERIYGESIMERFINRTTEVAESNELTQKIEDYIDAKMTARLLFQIHSHSVLSLPCQRENIKNDILYSQHLTEHEKKSVIHHLDQLPLKQQLCHGDPNPGNILFRGDEAVIIDWNNASIGNPEADLAEYIIMIRYAILPPNLSKHTKNALDKTRESSIRVFIDEYERLSGIGYAEVESWIVPMAARKLAADGITEEEKSLLVTEIRRSLNKSM
ncbi:aminoglycoside phosphotransferase family protein [Paenibacillus sp. FSL H7-0326]|uniref:aminoglycoside phosphotransferase family protein n=1 Tax=Paenibacillus sp. FSL H7-0326 TaxID=1921144 RepID=UPI0021161909|nr:aminoglycoside phosphotransferase family protein [Paenibacillus sp. FSL H7-0326]